MQLIKRGIAPALKDTRQDNPKERQLCPKTNLSLKTYLMVDALYNQLVQKPLRQGGFAPKLSDCELICMEIVGEFLGMEYR